LRELVVDVRDFVPQVLRISQSLPDVSTLSFHESSHRTFTSMSMPSQYAQQRTGGESSAEDCRDYLRTGRCKYGASCKYNHPSNVQSGGGMKAPVDPSEPMFPVRLNEPLCQYYVKHGTCKFGQACKFNHPAQVPLQAASMNGGTVLMNVGRKTDTSQLVLNPVGPVDSSGGSMMLQFLPQRPDEPDCIFLKNGCCKYGATCRYHHPINYHQRRVDDTRRTRGPSQDQSHAQKVQYVNHAGSHAAFTQGKVAHTDGPATYINMDGPPAQQGYQIITSNDGSSYGVPLGCGIVTEQGSAASSIASSYETANSNLEQLTSQGDFTSALWNRARKNGSGNSLSAYTADSSGHGRAQGNRSVIQQSGSDGSMSRHRAASNGSASDHSSHYFDAAPVPPTMSRSASGSLRHGGSVPYDNSRRIPMNQYGPRGDGIPPNANMAYDQRGGDHKSPASRGRPPVVSPRQRRRSPKAGESDEGFTMMTSALLNMLDTPEEAAERYIFQDPNQRHDLYEIDPNMFEGLSLNSSRREPGNYHPAHGHDPSSWSPSWQPTTNEGRQRVLQTHHGPGTSAPNDSDVGLYLP
jgi:hypothetical protein